MSTQESSASPCGLDEPEVERRISTHPCYSSRACRAYTRIHLPVAPKCNIQCRYCNRLYDCVNENRPGVTSSIMRPEEAVKRVTVVKSCLPQLTVAAVAGPGDPLANESTFQTFRLLRAAHPDLTFCLSTNGLLLPERARDIVHAGVSHVTVTINALDPEVGSKIYSWILDDGKIYRGVEAASLLLSSQLEGVQRLVENDILVKVNTVMIPGVNVDHISEVAKGAKRLGVFMHNIIPLIPVKGSGFENLEKPSLIELKRLRDECEVYIRQMRHCRQCRSDAVGFLGNDLSMELAKEGRLTKASDIRSIKVAVATRGDNLVSQHFGHAESFSIYRASSEVVEFLEKRDVSRYCFGKPQCGDEEDTLLHTVELLKDCQVVLCSRVGYGPRRALMEAGIEPVETYDTIENAIRKVVSQKLQPPATEMLVATKPLKAEPTPTHASTA